MQVHKFIEYDSVKPRNSEEQIYRFFKDIEDLFSHKKGGHVGFWQYSDSKYAGDPVRGAALWDRFISQSKDYYPLHAEVTNIQKSAQNLKQFFDSDICLIDLGCGPSRSVEQKIFPILDQLEITEYVPVDTCKSFVLEAREAVIKKNKNIKVTGLNANFLQDQISLPGGCNNLAVLFGSSITNVEGDFDNALPEKQITSQLKAIKNMIGDNAHLIVTYDTNQDRADILRAYLHPDQIAFGSNLMFRIKRDLPIMGKYSPEDWTYEPIWNPEMHQLAHCVYPKKKQSFLYGRDTYQIEVNERFILNNSYKFPATIFEQMASNAGFITKSVIKFPDNPIVMHILQA